MLVTIAYQRDGAVSGRHRWVRGASTLPHRTHSSGWWCAGDGGVVTDRVEDFRHVCYGRCLQDLHQLRVLARLCHIDRSFAIDVLCKGPYIERRGMVVSVIRRTWGERVRVRMCMRMRVRAASSSLSPPLLPPLSRTLAGVGMRIQFEAAGVAYIAPASSSFCATAVQPFFAAQCNAVPPHRLVANTDAPAWSSASTTMYALCHDAMCSAVFPSASLEEKKGTIEWGGE